MSQTAPAFYSRWQVGLHWLVVVLVALQYATSGSIGRTHDVSMSGLSPDKSDLFWHVVHNRVGLLIFAIMALRLCLRFWHGVPAGVTNMSSLQKKAAHLVHTLLYVTLMVQAFTGAVATYLWWPISVVHRNLFYVFAALVAVHILAAFWHHFMLKDETLKRMLKITKN